MHEVFKLHVHAREHDHESDANLAMSGTLVRHVSHTAHTPARTFPASTNTDGKSPWSSSLDHGTMSATCGPNRTPARISPRMGEAPIARMSRPAAHTLNKNNTTCRMSMNPSADDMMTHYRVCPGAPCGTRAWGMHAVSLEGAEAVNQVGRVHLARLNCDGI